MEVPYKKRYYSIGELAKSFNVNPSKTGIYIGGRKSQNKRKTKKNTFNNRNY